MNQVLVELDDDTLRRLNDVAPPRARKRSELIREAIRRALDRHLEQQMEEAYQRQPQDPTEGDLDPDTWEPVHFATSKRKKKA
jgi:Arc/MetJ-type ribon-helix-helix transcriptional regulator